MWYILIDKLLITLFYEKFTKILNRSIISLLVLFAFNPASWAITLDDATLTVPLNSSKTVTLTAEQVKEVKDFS
jgi:uncharacterized protein (DUF486 family)